MPKSRLRRIPNTGSSQMFVLAGLPKSLHNRAGLILRDLTQQDIKYVGIPSSERDGALYPENLISILVQATAGFTIRRRVNGTEQQSVPSSIMLLYVPSVDDEFLLRRFDFAVFPIPLHELALRDATGRQFRHSEKALTETLRRAMDPAGPVRQNLHIIKERIARLSDAEPFLLPPRNFHLERDKRIASLFEAFRRGERQWADRIPELCPQSLKKDNFSRLEKNETRKVFIDYRKLIFLKAHSTAYDGATRETEEGKRYGPPEDPERDLLLKLKGLYRFGAPLPNGFHHDVQREQGKTLEGVEFECARSGQVRGRASHANIYTNDFVRIERKENISPQAN